MLRRYLQIALLLSITLVACSCRGIDKDQSSKANHFEIGQGVEVPADQIQPPVKIQGAPPEKFVLGAPKIYRKKTNRVPLPTTEKVSILPSETKVFDASDNNYPTPIPIQSQPVLAETPTTISASSTWRDNGGKSVFYTPRDGLIQTNNNVLVCAKDGAIWGGSRWAGAWKYDGYSFTYFNEAMGMIDYAVVDMIVDRDGDAWFGMSTGLSKYDGTHFTHYLGENEISQKKPTKLAEDQTGNIWVGSNEGLCKIDKSQNTITHFDVAHGLLQDEVNAILFDREGNLWIAYNAAGISRMSFDLDDNKDDYQIDHFKISKEFALHNVQCMVESRQGDIFIGTNRDLIHLRKNDGQEGDAIQLSTYSIGSLGLGFIFDMVDDNKNQLWVISENRIAQLHSDNNGENLSISYLNQEHIPMIQNISLAATIDQDQNIWMAHSDGGLTKILHNDAIASYLNEFGANGEVLSIAEDARGDIWFTSKYEGLFCLKNDKISGEEILLQYSDEQGIPNLSYQVEIDQSDNIWVSSQRDLYQIIQSQDNDQGLVYKYGSDQGLPPMQISQLMIDKKGDLWIAYNSVSTHDKVETNSSLGSAYRWDGEHFYKYTQDQGLYRSDVIQIYEDEAGNYWFRSIYYGLTKYVPGKDNELGHWVHFPNADQIYGQIYAGGYLNNGIWFSQTEQLLEFSAVTNEIKDIKIERLPIEPTLMGDFRKFFIKNENGQLWVGSNYGLELFLPAVIENGQPTYQSRKLFMQDGIPMKWINAFEQMSDGKIWVGTLTDLISIEAESLISNQEKIDVSMFRAFQQDKEIKTLNALNYQENELRFEFNAIEVNQQHNLNYRFKLEGYDKHWSKPDIKNIAEYRKLPSGRFTFKAQARMGVGEWGPIFSEKISISPPWWRSGWAYAIYVLSLIGFIYLIWRNKLHQLEQQNLIEKEQMASDHLRMIDETKTNFFTNLSHEFRTPLTVILGMSGEIEKPSKAKILIQQSGQNLMRLVNQMLDFSKMEAGKLKLNIKPGELISYVRYQMESVQSLAEYKRIKLSFESDVEKLMMEYDEDKIQHIVTNLLSNAIKFTPIGGQVKMKLTTQNNHLTISIEDTGIGISKDKLPLIFDRFYQGQEAITKGTPGTGIGLSFARQLVTLMNGQIEVQSEEGVGSAFKVILPLHLSEATAPATAPYQRRQSLDEVQQTVIHDDDQPVLDTQPELLLVEDNPEVVAYIQHILGDRYRIITAEDGRQGIEKALELVPDIIISDVMMPFKDGFEVTDTLKNDERTSHIPIILLTAKADAASRLEGLKRKADAYLSKPFDKAELLIRLENMLELRKNMQARYGQILVEELVSAPEMVLEDAFLRKVNELIDDHISDPKFVVEELAQATNMSGSQLYRKIKALTGQTAVAYLRSYRLRKAKDLLQQKDLTVSEVAYQVGFSDPGYFTRVFSKEFGSLPTEIQA